MGHIRFTSADGAEHFAVVLEKVHGMWLREPQLTAEDLRRVAARVLVMAGDRDLIKLEHTVEMSAGARVDTSCTSDPTAGWDYYCTSSDGSRSLYDVSAGRITQRVDIPSYR